LADLFAFWRDRLKARAGAARQRRVQGNPQDPTILDAARQRLGYPRVDRPRGPLLWVHVAADATPAALALLLGRLRDDRAQVSVLVTTETSLDLSEVIVQLPPADTDDAALAFLAHWAPDACLWLGSGWAPVLLLHTARRAIPALCADARTAGNRPRPRRWTGGQPVSALTAFEKILTGSPGEANRLIALGAPAERVETCGWLEASAGALPCSDAEWGGLAETFEARPLWLAAEVPEAEYAAISEAHRLASRLSHRLVLLWVPADPAEGPALRDRLEAEGWQTALRSRDENPREDTQIYIADTVGELGLWYRLAPVTYLGQTLSGAGPGRSPMEPAAPGSVVVHGPHTEGHAAAYARFRRVSAQCAVTSGGELGRMVERLQAADKAADLAGAAWEVMTTGAEATDRALALLNDALNRTAR